MVSILNHDPTTSSEFEAEKCEDDKEIPHFPCVPNDVKCGGQKYSSQRCFCATKKGHMLTKHRFTNEIFRYNTVYYM